MGANRKARWQAAALSVITLASTSLVVVGSASPAQADPDCVNGGVYVLFARGSGEHFNDTRANAFYWATIGSEQNPGSLRLAGVTTAWAELGNLNGDNDPQDHLDEGEYPAAAVP